jgi:heat shock protein HtpX
VIRLGLSRSREFLADAGSVELTKNPDAMILALRKIEGRGELHGATSAVMEMCLDNPREEFTDLFSTHPSVDARVKALVDVLGGHDPGPIALPGPEEAHGEASPGAMAGGPWGDSADPGASPSAAPPGAPPGGPWGEPAPGEPQRPFLPDRSPIDPGRPPAGPSGDGRGGPWGKPGG